VVKRRRIRGLSMFEASVAVVVLSVIATSVALTGSSHMRFFARSHEETVAGRAAASRIERVVALRQPLADGKSEFDIGPEAKRTLRSAAATQVVTHDAPGLARVETEVTWQAADGGTGRVRLATLVAEEPRR
jgi:Tfp pilus assembly protein PilV